MPKQAPSFVCKSPETSPAFAVQKCKLHCFARILLPSLSLSSARRFYCRSGSSRNNQIQFYLMHGGSEKRFLSADSPLSVISRVCCQVLASWAKQTAICQVCMLYLLINAEWKQVDIVIKENWLNTKHNPAWMFGPVNELKWENVTY